MKTRDLVFYLNCIMLLAPNLQAVDSVTEKTIDDNFKKKRTMD